MIRWNRVAAASACAIIITAIVLAVTPVTIQPSSILPGALRDMLPAAAQTAEISCGSVLNPTDPPGFDGILASVSSAAKTDCTRAVRDRMWKAVWVLLVGVAVLLIGVIALRRVNVSNDNSKTDSPGRSPKARHTVARASFGVMAALLAIAPAACSREPERSTEAFCSTMKSEQARILAQFNATVDAGNASDDGMVAVLSGLGASIQAIGELRTYFHKLSAVAPQEIRTETEIVAQGYDDQLNAAKDALSDPLGALGSSLLGGMMMSGQLDTINQFALQQCGQSI